MATTALIAPTLILLAGVVDDLRARKVHNWVVLVCAAVGLTSQILISGVNGLGHSAIGFLAALALTLPLVFSRILGAGDMKLLAAFGLAVNAYAVFVTVIASFFWGALLGMFRAILGGHGRVLFKNTYALARGKTVEPTTLTKIPYTVALFFGWASYVALEMKGFVI